MATNNTDAVWVEKIALPHVRKEYIAFVIHNLYTAKECEEMVARTEDNEKHQYDRALVNVGYGQQELHTDVRNNDRCIIDDFDMASDMYTRLLPYLPKYFNNQKLLCVNERMRFLRYDPGHYFKPHYDGAFARTGQRSQITIQLYLNEGFKGGATNFLTTDLRTKVPIVPKTGSVLIFNHALLHEGEEVREGRKYAVRTDAMYTLTYADLRRDRRGDDDDDEEEEERGEAY